MLHVNHRSPVPASLCSGEVATLVHSWLHCSSKAQPLKCSWHTPLLHMHLSHSECIGVVFWCDEKVLVYTNPTGVIKYTLSMTWTSKSTCNNYENDNFRSYTLIGSSAFSFHPCFLRKFIWRFGVGVNFFRVLAFGLEFGDVFLSDKMELGTKQIAFYFRNSGQSECNPV